MGYALAYGNCFACNRVFGFNPHSVPSFAGSPICKDCIERVNPMREKNGLEPFVPLPDAYEPIAEEEL